MSVQWRTAPKRPLGPAFIRVPPTKVVCLLCKPADYAVLEIHWAADQNGSFPCLGKDECPYCPARKWLTTYGPALVWVPRAARWVQGIMPLGDPVNTVATEDLQGVAVLLGKDKEGENRARTILYGNCRDDKIPPPPLVRSFDVRPFLLRRWGLFKEADLIECAFHPAAPVLSFPPSEIAS